MRADRVRRSPSGSAKPITVCPDRSSGRLGRNGSHLQDDVGGREDVGSRGDLRAGLLVGGVGKSGGSAGVLLDDHVEAGFFQRARRPPESTRPAFLPARFLAERRLSWHASLAEMLQASWSEVLLQPLDDRRPPPSARRVVLQRRVFRDLARRCRHEQMIDARDVDDFDGAAFLRARASSASSIGLCGRNLRVEIALDDRGAAASPSERPRAGS